MAVILTDPADYEAVRTIVGLDLDNLDDDHIIDTYIEPVEADIVDILQSHGVGLTAAQIMAGTNGATANDKTHLIEAARNYVAYKATPALPILLNTSESVGPETIDQGATSGWEDQAARYLMECDRHLGKITGFLRWRTL